MWSDLLASEKQTEVSVQHFYKLFEYEMLICHSISVEIVLIWN